MKKVIVYFIISLAAFSLYGCSKPSQSTDFIPTQAVTPKPDGGGQDVTTPPGGDGQAVTPTPDGQSAKDSTSQETKAETSPTDEPVYVGKTTTKYVKVNSYGGTLYVRSEPSKDAEIAGFLVHTEKIEVISIENGWASFVYNGKISYVNADFLVDKKPKYIDPPTPTPKPAPTATPVPEADKAPDANTAPDANADPDVNADDPDANTNPDEAPPEI